MRPWLCDAAIRLGPRNPAPRNHTVMLALLLVDPSSVRPTPALFAAPHSDFVDLMRTPPCVELAPVHAPRGGVRGVHLRRRRGCLVVERRCFVELGFLVHSALLSHARVRGYHESSLAGCVQVARGLLDCPHHLGECRADHPDTRPDEPLRLTCRWCAHMHLQGHANPVPSIYTSN